MISDLAHLLFPKLCLVCSGALARTETDVCVMCESQLTYCPNDAKEINIVDKIFWGRVEIQKASSVFQFQKDGSVQQLLHQFKYGGKRELGEWIAKKLSKRILDADILSKIDIIVPVPTHFEKLKIRGYNQAAVLGHALSLELGKPCHENVLERISQANSQIHFNRSDRLNNVAENFRLQQPHLIKGKNVLIVDDVVTTGATLEVCIEQLRKAADKVFIGVAAYAS